jgi:MoaA/NifB/PqqE/SkfB family radical SAM enzyme
MFMETPPQLSPGKEFDFAASLLPAARSMQRAVIGKRQRFTRFLIWCNILVIALVKSKNIFKALRSVKKLKALRDQYRNQHAAVKYFKTGNKYFISYNTPAWPSKAFNRYVDHLLNRFFNQQGSLNTLVFAITKKCGFQCEHCCEWEVLNKPEALSKETLLSIIQRFRRLGVSQVQLSGGEPLNRFDDILYLLSHGTSDIDFWLYTSGYQLTEEKAMLLKKHGLRGITISLDDYREEMHDRFRGKKGAFRRALHAAHVANKNGLVVCFSLCATRSFIAEKNLLSYAGLAKDAGASFIQILEPKAVGRFAGKDVLLEEHHEKILEDFFETVNYTQAYAAYPVITYHGFYTRRVGCSGAGKDYVYVDTDGYVHNCPFCQRKMFHALDSSFFVLLQDMKAKGCSAYNLCSTIN